MNAPALTAPTGLGVPAGITPSSARLTHWLLGGEHHHHPADRLLGTGILKAAPWFETAVETARRYAHTTVRMLTGRGIKQFVDLGSGLPTPNPRLPPTSVSAGPAATVLHIDADPYVIRHGPGLLPDGTRHRFLHADLRNMHQILRELPLHGLDPAQPTAFLMHNVLEQIPSGADARAIVTPVLSLAPPGSVLSLTHATADLCPDGSAETAARCFTTAGLPMQLRTATEIRGLLEPPAHRAWHIRAPGITAAAAYHATHTRTPAPAHTSGTYAAILVHPDAPR
ncbi:SAM-dependent methyltransferase [Streptomyces sp. NPDC058195]|uniref:SAM-dependent methyltransferase n=1 Tax=Streptomyces sp. NPDC058195 TaxID=3346375 RepID=UPI0036EED2E6